MSIDTNYADPNILVDTDWVSAFGNDPGVRLVEVDVNTTSYEKGHIAEAIGFNGLARFADTDIPGKEPWEALLSEAGIANDSTVVLYGDNHNGFATFALWLFKVYGHEKVYLLDGGHKRWEREGLPLVTEVSSYPRTNYVVSEVHEAELRVSRDQVLAGVASGEYQLVDVGSPDRSRREIIAPHEMSVNIPWEQAINDDDTFRTKQELAALYGSKGVDGSKDTVVYSRTGEGASHIWFALKYLLGYKNVRIYCDFESLKK